MSETRTSLSEDLPRTSSNTSRRRRKRYSALRSIALGAIIVFFAVPIVWMVLAAFKQNIDVVDSSKTIFFTPTLNNFVKVFTQEDFGLFIWNSLFVAVVATGISLVIALPAAFAMARFLMPKSAASILLARVVPGISLLVPWYFIFSNLGLIQGYGALLLSHMFIALPLILWILMAFFEGLPEELEEAGQMDGLTAIGAFVRIALPLSRPGIATATILAFIFSWNNFLFSLVLSDSSTGTLPVAIFNFIGFAGVDWGSLMAASVVVTAPVMVVALFAQKHIVSGLTAGATKG